MKTLGALVVALALALSVQTAEAHIVQFVAVVPMTAVDGGQDEAAVSNIILTAVKDALRQAVAFEPTLVVVEDARVVGGHLYLRVLAADSEGEALIEELENARAPVGRVTSRDASPGPGREVIHLTGCSAMLIQVLPLCQRAGLVTPLGGG